MIRLRKKGDWEISSPTSKEEITEFLLATSDIKNLRLNGIEDAELPPLPNTLEKLDVLCCKNLLKLPESISQCKQLKDIYLYSNENLGKLPESISECQSLENLLIWDCKKITEITNLPANFEKLTIQLDKSDEPQSTPKLVNCTNLQFLHLRGEGFNSISALPDNIKTLRIECDNLPILPKLPNSLHSLGIYCGNHLKLSEESINELRLLKENKCEIACSYNLSREINEANTETEKITPAVAVEETEKAPAPRAKNSIANQLADKFKRVFGLKTEGQDHHAYQRLP